VALRPRLSAGVPLSWDCSTQIERGTAGVKCGPGESQPLGQRLHSEVRFPEFQLLLASESPDAASGNRTRSHRVVPGIVPRAVARGCARLAG
jgi:hypothetical protein